MVLEVGHPTDVVDNRKICNIVEKAIDPDVPAKGILLWCSETVYSDGISFFCLYLLKFRPTSESGNLNDLSPFEKDLNQSKSASDDPAVFKEGIDLMGASIGGNIEVLRNLPEKKVTDASSNEISKKPVSMEAVENF
jgi:hypothetical protein